MSRSKDITVVVDPGAEGGLVAALGSTVIEAIHVPPTQEAIARWLHEKRMQSDRFRIFMEQVGGYVGGDGQPGSRMFNFGEGFGFVKGWAAGVGVPLILVTPFSWQQRLNLGLAGECKSKAEWKRKLRAKAVELYGELKPTLATADALLLWDWVRVHRPWRTVREA